MRRKNCVFLPATGRRTQYFLLIFTEPRAHNKVHPVKSLKICQIRYKDMLCNLLQKIKNYRTLEDGVVIAVAAALILLSLHLNDIPLPRVLLSRCIAPDCRWVFKVLALSTACCCILASCNLRAMYKGRLLHFWNYAPPPDPHCRSSFVP